MRVKIQCSAGTIQFKSPLSAEDSMKTLNSLEGEGPFVLHIPGMGTNTHFINLNNIEYMEVSDE